MYAASKPAAIQWGVAVDQTKECIPTIQAIIALRSITGNIDIPGGNVIKSRLFNLDQVLNKYIGTLPDGQEKKKIGKGMYPLVLTTGGKTRSFFHSEHRQIPSLRRMNPDPLTEIHPDTAETLGVKDGDWIYIENKYGRCKQRANLTSGIHPRVVHAQHGWWFPEKPGSEPSLFGAWESNINLLLPAGWTGRAGFGYPFKAQMCKVYKV
jgi:anaerobic selenocysteine-containing dehydrogenase